MKTSKLSSLNRKAFLAISISGLITLIFAFSLFYIFTFRSMEDQISDNAKNIAALTASNPEIKNAYLLEDPASTLQSMADEIEGHTNAAFVVFLNENSIRYTHPNRALVGERFTGGDEALVYQGNTYSSKAVGYSGPSIRAFAPIYDSRENLVGAVSVGFFKPEIRTIMDKLYNAFYLVIPLALVVFLFFSWILSKNIINIMFGLQPMEIATSLKERQTMLESIKEGVIAINTDHEVTVINNAAKDLFPPNTNFIGVKIDSLIPNTQLPGIIKSKQTENDKYLLIHNNTVIVNRIPLIINGESVGAIATFRPLTEYNKLAEELTGVNQIVAALRARTHEFQNKLHVILGLIQLESYDEAQRYISNVSNKEQNFLTFLMKNINNSSILGLLMGKASEAEEKSISFIVKETSFLVSLPDKCDENAMVVILGNLIENAFDEVISLNADRRNVELSIIQDELKIEIIVKDKGTGVSKENIDKLFVEGFTTKAKGQGLGLANVYKRVQASGGSIDFVSNKKGTVFTITIPTV